MAKKNEDFKQKLRVRLKILFIIHDCFSSEKFENGFCFSLNFSLDLCPEFVFFRLSINLPHPPVRRIRMRTGQAAECEGGFIIVFSSYRFSFSWFPMDDVITKRGDFSSCFCFPPSMFSPRYYSAILSHLYAHVVSM